MSKKEKKKQIKNKANKDSEQVLREAEIIARWRKKPFYIS